MFKRALVKAVTIARISIRKDHVVIGLEDIPDSFGLHLEYDHHETAHEEATVGLLVV